MSDYPDPWDDLGPAPKKAARPAPWERLTHLQELASELVELGDWDTLGELSDYFRHLQDATAADLDEHEIQNEIDAANELMEDISYTIERMGD